MKLNMYAPKGHPKPNINRSGQSIGTQLRIQFLARQDLKRSFTNPRIKRREY